MTFQIPQLENFAEALFQACGMDKGKAQTAARLLLLTDAMGRRTHGQAMAALYLADIQKGGMTVSGDAQVVKDNGISAVWDGNYLPGLWLVDQAIKLAIFARADAWTGGCRDLQEPSHRLPGGVRQAGRRPRPGGAGRQLRPSDAGAQPAARFAASAGRP